MSIVRPAPKPSETLKSHLNYTYYYLLNELNKWRCNLKRTIRVIITGVNAVDGASVTLKRG
jgi:hypothetical protein